MKCNLASTILDNFIGHLHRSPLISWLPCTMVSSANTQWFLLKILSIRMIGKHMPSSLLTAKSRLLGEMHIFHFCFSPVKISFHCYILDLKLQLYVSKLLIMVNSRAAHSWQESCHPVTQYWHQCFTFCTLFVMWTCLFCNDLGTELSLCPQPLLTGLLPFSARSLCSCCTYLSSPQQTCAMVPQHSCWAAKS